MLVRAKRSSVDLGVGEDEQSGSLGRLLLCQTLEKTCRVWLSGKFGYDVGGAKGLEKAKLILVVALWAGVT